MVFNFIAALFVAVVLSVLSYAIAPKPRLGGRTGDPRREFRAPTSETGRPIPVVFGTATVESPNVLHHDHKGAEPTGHRANYYMSLHYGIAQGPIDRIRRIRFDGKTALSEVPTALPTLRRSLRITDFYGGNEKDGGISGWYSWQDGSFSQTLTESMAYVYGDLAEDAPAYRGIATILFSGDFTNGYRGFWWGRNPVVPPADFMVERIPRYWYPSKAAIPIPDGAPTGYTDELTGLGVDFGPDSNPAHIIHECLTNDVWGGSIPVDDIDDESFRRAADTFHAEGLGLSIIWDRQEEIESFIQSVMDQVEAVLYLDVYDGLFKLRPLRGDYSLDSLPAFDTQSAEIISIARSLPAEIPNDIALKWTNPGTEKTELIKRQNIVGVQRAGAVISDNRPFFGIRNAITAAKIADREVASATEKMLVGEVKLDRTGSQMRPGDVFKLTSEDHQLDGHVVRAVNIDYGAPGDERIRVNFVEDIFARTAPNFEQLGQGGTPTSPRRFNLTAEDGGVLLDWIEPRDDGGSPILFYQFQQDGGAWQAASGLATQHRVTGLVNGQTYTFRVRAVNAVGPGAPSIQLSIGPDDTPVMVPGVPRDFQGITFGSEAEIRWAEPISDGGATIIRYEYDLDESDDWIAIPETSRFIHRILNLELERTYRIRLRAVNSVGAGDATWPIDLVTRDLTLPGYARPPQAKGLVATGGIGVALLTWDNPFAHYQNHARTVVYRSATPNVDDAEQIGISAGISYVDELPSNLLGEGETTFHYWIAWQSNFGIIGDRSESASAVVSEDPAAAIRRISALVLADPLTKDLLSPLGALDEDSDIDRTGLLIAINEIEAIRAEKLSGQHVAEQLVRDYVTFLGRAVAKVDETANAAASAVTVLTARVEEEAGRITAVASSVTQLMATVETLDGRLTGTANAVQALVTRVSATENEIDVVSSAVTMLNSRIQTAEGTITANADAVRGLTTRVTEAEGMVTAISSSVTDLSTRLTDAEGNIQGEARARETLEVRVTRAENLEGGTTVASLARWTVKTTVNGRTGGIGLVNDGTSTRLIINADRFAIISPNTVLGSNAVVPFVVDGNRVYIDSVVIRDASITSVKASNAFLTNLTAVHGTLSTARIDKGNIFDLTIGNSIQSDNFSATAGWAILRDGTAVFDAASIRGKLTADQVDADVRNYDVLFYNAAGQRTGWMGTSLSLLAPVTDYLAVEFLVSGRGTGPVWTPHYANVANFGTSDAGTGNNITVDPLGADNAVRFWRDSTGRTLFNTQSIGRYVLYVHAIFGIRRLGSTSTPTPTTTTTRTRTVYRRGTSTPTQPTGGTATEDHTPTGWSATRLTPTSTESVYRSTRTETLRNGVFASATAWGSVVLDRGATGVTTTRTRTIYRTGTSAPTRPTGGTTSASAPTGWSFTRLSPTETLNVYRSSRTETLLNNVFQSATAWGAVQLDRPATGTPPPPPPPTDPPPTSTIPVPTVEWLLTSLFASLSGNSVDYYCEFQADDNSQFSSPYTAYDNTPSTGSWQTLGAIAGTGTFYGRARLRTATNGGGMAGDWSQVVSITRT